MSGTVGILNVGAGDTKLVFDPKNPMEALRSARIVRDMLRRGYALFVEVERDGEKRFERALDFIEGTGEYVIADLEPTAAAAPQEMTTDAEIEAAPRPEAATSTASAPTLRRGGGRRAVKASSTRAVAVARTAGG
jgi:hypothetical protein